ncbi:guanine nucleotide-binding protein subunit beta-2-like [Tropilaelaps mercedesae]|uniref:Guanine nucleotide-binding protein subunit beta-2-like n=1 Tax=Tropilaelaps mercedesae TaxID=418985 RepID=A0A1V9XC23_9ACAR|nr:guanine nucleotide-binding protein subunit beta-2-like [Tropilaelaps mercedesae]
MLPEGHAVSASLDGKLMIWDTWSGNKVRIIPLRTTWIMGAAFESSGRFVAVGGMDNMCTIYDLDKKWTGNGAGGEGGGVLGAALVRELAGLQGYLSCCVFVHQDRIIVGSADTKVDNNIFVTASMDKTCKLFDLRRPDQCRQSFEGHELDVNDVSFQNNGHMFTSCSEDKTCRLFDIRSDLEVASFREPNKQAAFTCVANSKSGRLLLAGADDDTVHIWDIVGGSTPEESHLGNLWGHDGRISSMSMAPNGMAAVTASWDSSMMDEGLPLMTEQHCGAGRPLRLVPADILSRQWD